MAGDGGGVGVLHKIYRIMAGASQNERYRFGDPKSK